MIKLSFLRRVVRKLLTERNRKLFFIGIVKSMGMDNRRSILSIPIFKLSKIKIIIGGNIGKNKITPNEDAWRDYEKCFLALHDYVDYFVVNVSSPNTPGLRELQEKDALLKILSHLQTINHICQCLRDE